MDTTENPQRAGRQRQVLDIDITFSDTRRGPRGARGGRAPRTGLNTTPGGTQFIYLSRREFFLYSTPILVRLHGYLE